jgi:hypothetical protein
VNCLPIDLQSQDDRGAYVGAISHLYIKKRQDFPARKAKAKAILNAMPSCKNWSG